MCLISSDSSQTIAKILSVAVHNLMWQICYKTATENNYQQQFLNRTVVDTCLNFQQWFY
jgi:hypothetical protein